MEGLTNENKVFIRTIFNEMRKSLQAFMDARDFSMSNAQLFTFLSNSPAAFAIAGDGTVDDNEIAVLERLVRAIDVNAMVNIDLQEFMSVAFEPENIMTNEEFNLRVGSELLFLARNADKYEADFINALKAMLTFDMNPKADGSMTSSFKTMMDAMIENNKSKNKAAEKKKLDEFKAQIGIA